MCLPANLSCFCIICKQHWFKNSKFNKLSNSTHFRFVKITTQASEKHDNQHGKQSNYPYFKLAPWNGVNIFSKGNNNIKHSFQHLLISVKRVNQTIRVFQKCFESTLYLVEKNVIGNKRQMHTVLFKQSGCLSSKFGYVITYPPIFNK